MAYESLARDASAEVRRIAAFLGYPAARTEQLLPQIVHHSSFARMKQRHAESDGGEAGLRNAGASEHFRKGEAGGWREQLSDTQHARFEQALRQRLGGHSLADVLHWSRGSVADALKR